MESILEIDRQLLLWMNFDGGAVTDSIFWFASGKAVWIPLYVLIIWLMQRKIGWRRTLLAVALIALAVVLSDQIANIFKHCTIKEYVHTVNGYRGGLYGTVSAHAATTFSIAAISAYTIRSRLYTAAIALWVLFVSYSRIYLGVHFPLDILFGMITGAAVSAAAILLYEYATRKFASVFRRS